MNSIMKYLNYKDCPQLSSYKSNEARNYLRKKSYYSCSYCTITESEAPGATFHIDHFRPKSIFVGLRDECTNLRYSCPRCNLLKSNLWITFEQGCIRKCEECNTKGCHENIYRFIDSLYEDPQLHLVLSDKDKIEAVSGSKPGEYTIKYLRLNRMQLVKLRKVRRFLDLWEQELNKKREYAVEQWKNIVEKKELFDKKSQLRDDNNIELANILFSMLELQARHMVDVYDNELTKVLILRSSRSGADDTL
ncbi:HNH endonuclease [Lacrimispora sp.]|uniref:HNH endonuclease n=1 Tax=Lacrimispora sp. TaxID=2719234 RepID=UPI003992AAED